MKIFLIDSETIICNTNNSIHIYGEDQSIIMDDYQLYTILHQIKSTWNQSYFKHDSEKR